MATTVDILRSCGRLCLDLVLPPRCPGCGLVVDGDHRFCVDCWRSLEFLGPPACPCCASPLPDDMGMDALCAACHDDPPDFDRARAAVAYGDVARTMALRLKYGRRPGIARTMGHHMARLVRDAPAGALLAPVPLHRWRLWRRGYNQALLIARDLAARCGLSCRSDLIRRTRATPPLRGLGRRERARSLSGAFAVPWPEQVRGRVILLVDDVYTSGATGSACARVLRQAGAREVWLVCWSRVIRTDDG